MIEGAQSSASSAGVGWGGHDVLAGLEQRLREGCFMDGRGAVEEDVVGGRRLCGKRGREELVA